jgi:hypothetical protein
MKKQHQQPMNVKPGPSTPSAAICRGAAAALIVPVLLLAATPETAYAQRRPETSRERGERADRGDRGGERSRGDSTPRRSDPTPTPPPTPAPQPAPEPVRRPETSGERSRRPSTDGGSSRTEPSRAEPAVPPAPLTLPTYEPRSRDIIRSERRPDPAASPLAPTNRPRFERMDRVEERLLVRPVTPRDRYSLPRGSSGSEAFSGLAAGRPTMPSSLGAPRYPNGSGAGNSANNGNNTSGGIVGGHNVPGIIGTHTPGLGTPGRGSMPAPGTLGARRPDNDNGLSRPTLPGSLPRPDNRRYNRRDDTYYHNYPYGYGYSYGYNPYGYTPYGYRPCGHSVYTECGCYRVAPSGGVTVIVPAYNDTFVFGGYATTYAPGVSVYSPYWYYNSPTFIRRESVIIAPYAYESGREQNNIRPWRDDDRFFGSDTARGNSLRAAMNDLSRFWEENDLRALRRRVNEDLAVGVFEDEKYAYSLKRPDFVALSNDAIDRITTISFRWNAVRDRTDGLVNAYATHVFRVRNGSDKKAAADGATQTATVRYTLVYVDGDWYVSAISHAPVITDASTDNAPTQTETR